VVVIAAVVAAAPPSAGKFRRRSGRWNQRDAGLPAFFIGPSF
jgi:hypothetical protein